MKIPKNRRPTSPGQFVKSTILNQYPMSQGELAKLLGITRKHVNSLVNEKSSLTIDMAYRLAKITNTSPESWIEMQLKVDLYNYQKSEAYEYLSTLETLPSIENLTA